MTVANAGDGDRATGLLRVVEGEETLGVELARVVVDRLGGGPLSEPALQQLMERFGSTVVAREMDEVGHWLVGEGRADVALELFELNADVLPDAWPAWTSLGDAHLALGNDDEALAAYARALELNPQQATNRTMENALRAAVDGDTGRARTLLNAMEGRENLRIRVIGMGVEFLGGDRSGAEGVVRQLSGNSDPAQVEGEVNALGYWLMREGRADLALELFELNTRVFPDAWNAWDSLGEAHFTLGNREEAARAYERSVALNPENEAGKRVLVGLRGSSGR